ncbi:MAG: prepilin-type N-terminal cleavage/methylation domain-containing protein [Planctomycetota bacterium]
MRVRPSAGLAHKTGRRRTSRPRRSGLTLLEVVAASVVLAIALAPALRIVRTALLAADRIDRQERCLMTATDRIEYLMSRGAADWAATEDPAHQHSSAAVPGYPGLRLRDDVWDSPAVGGIQDRLANIEVTAWYDDDGDAALDADEPQVTLTTAVARLTAYELHAGP